MKIGARITLVAFVAILIASFLAGLLFKPPRADDGYDEKTVIKGHYYALNVLAESLAYKKDFIRSLEEEVRLIKDKYRYKGIPYPKWNPVEQERYNLGNWRILGMKKDYNTMAKMYMEVIVNNRNFTKKETLPEGIAEPLPEKFELF